MTRGLLAAASLAVMTLGAPVVAQQQQPPPAQAPAEAEALVGLPVYSSDGEKLGDVTHVGMLAGQQTVRAEMGAFMGLGPNPVLIPATMFERKPDRIEVAMSAAEVRETITKQKEENEQKQQQAPK